MSNIGVISRKELGAYLISPMAYVVTAVFLALSGTFFSAHLVMTNYTDTSIRGFVNAAPVLIILFAVVLTMRSVTEERKLGTWELLLTSPVRDADIILGKFVGSLAVLVIMLGLTLYYTGLLTVFGDPDLGPIATSYLGLLLLGSASLSVGIFASTLSSNQIVSAVVSGGILFGLWILGTIGRYVPAAFQEVLSHFSLSEHFPAFVRGVVDTRSVVYYLSVTAMFLYLAVASIDTGRWR